MRTKCACSGKDGVSSRWSRHPFVLFWPAMFVVVSRVKYDVMLGKVWDLFYSRMIADPVFHHLLLLLSVSLRPAKPLKQAIKIDPFLFSQSLLAEIWRRESAGLNFQSVVKCYHFIVSPNRFRLKDTLFQMIKTHIQFSIFKKLCYTKILVVLRYCDNIKWKWSNTMVMNAYHKLYTLVFTVLHDALKYTIAIL